METDVERELGELRRRAYGPHADIHEDRPALERLRELEAETRPAVQSGPSVSDREPGIAPIVGESNSSATDGGAPPGPPWWSSPPRFRPRRSTVVIAIAAALVVTSAATALTVAERVQVDPLQPKARQVARLAVDRTAQPPRVFGGPDGHVFATFHGLAASVATVTSFVAGGAHPMCLTVYMAANVKDSTANTFTGFANVGCQAAGFPAHVQFALDDNELPSELRSAFPSGTALQFVYDQRDNEVVVFASP